jgi:predicted nucleic acid-binding protein
MSETVLIDTGPLVSYLVRGSEHHEWTVEQWKRLAPPLRTCEPVLTEAEHLLRRENKSAAALLELVEAGVLAVTFAIADELPSLKQFLHRYRNVPMSLADACLVRMSEIRDRCVVMTADSRFRIYRRHGRQTIPVLMPPLD